MVRMITQIITPPKKKNFKSLFLQIEKIFQIPATFYVTLRTLEKPSVHDPQPRPKFESSMLNNKPVGNGKLHQYLRPETKNVKIRNSFNSLFFHTGIYLGIAGFTRIYRSFFVEQIAGREGYIDSVTMREESEEQSTCAKKDKKEVPMYD